MTEAPIPPNEDLRLAALRRYDILDTSPEPGFDRITTIASRLLNAPVVLISLLDEDRQWFKAAHGVDATETPRSHAFCAYTILDEKPLVIEDTTKDHRTDHNPMVVGPPNVRFYAGAPLITSDGMALGSLCIVDRNPRQMDSAELDLLEDLADAVVDQLELRHSLAQARRLLDERVEMIASVSHEIRNPLAGASGLTEILLELDSDSERRDLLGSIRGSLRDVDSIIDDLMVLTRSERGVLEFNCRPIEVGNEIEAVLESMERDAKNDILVQGAIHAVVNADPMRLRQILRNLVTNADRYGGEQVRIVVEEGVAVVIEVRDNGPGVAEEAEATLFEAFSGSAKRHHLSTGLGLSISRRLARAMEGDLVYERDEETVFRLNLPAASDESANTE